MTDWTDMLPSAVAPAFLGPATRSAGLGDFETKPAFDWRVAAAGLRSAGMDPQEASEILQDQRALWVVPISRTRYWHCVRYEGLPVWDGWQPACVGVVNTPAGRVAVYSREKCLSLLEDGFVDSAEPVLRSVRKIRALAQIDEVMDSFLGELTPFFITK